jgi:ubiquinone/menaquinone biosynthesis C-methylase UbiE
MMQEFGSREDRMPEYKLSFDDGAAYEQMMGIWSRLAGAVFLDWLAPAPGLRWIDAGCGNGAFTELLIERCAPAEVQGIDPSEAQIAFARERLAGGVATFQTGDAMALPFPADRFDAGVMALVLVFLPDPAKGVAELMRVVAPGGAVATYMWDIEHGGFPLEPFLAELRAMGISPTPPRTAASRTEVMRKLWSEAGVAAIETREIGVRRTFASFEDFWATGQASSWVGPTLRAMTPREAETLQGRMRDAHPADASGRLTLSARANAIKGVRPR